MQNKNIYITIINIGNELLLGKTINTNLTWLADKLTSMGAYVNKAVIVADNLSEIKAVLNENWGLSDLMIITGGLGPTKDDITKKCIADFFNKEMIFIQEIEDIVIKRFSDRGIEMPLSNKNQAFLPKDFEYLVNDLGTAPGLKYVENHKLLYCLPGVPFEMKHLFERYIMPDIKQRFRLNSFKCYDIHTYQLPESKIADDMQEMVYDDVNIAWLPQTGRVDIRVYGHNRDKVEEVKDLICEKFEKNIWGVNEVSPQNKLHNLINKANISLSTAESCTGGLIAKMMTDIPGSSACFQGSVVVYSNEQKENLLKIGKDILDDYGAVSQQTLEAMLYGCKDLFKTELLCAVTGIAGPDGGTNDKPVGTVFIGIMYKDKLLWEKCYFTGTREIVRHKSAEKAIFMMINMLEAT